MGHYCRYCGRSRPNERFSGRGHRNHVCRDCAQIPKAIRQTREQFEEIMGFLHQSRISEKNQARLRDLMDSSASEIARAAAAVLTLALKHPLKRRRIGNVRRNDAALWNELVALGLFSDSPELHSSWREPDYVEESDIHDDVPHSTHNLCSQDALDVVAVDEGDDIPF